MKNLRRFYVAVVFTLLLATHTYAGDMHTPAPTPPLPTPTAAQGKMTTGLNGTMHTGIAGDMHTTEAAAGGGLAGALMNMVQGVLSLL